METKKILVPFDLSNPQKKISGFLYPNIYKAGIDSFLEIEKKREWTTGMVVLLNTKITQNDLFAKIVDSGTVINSVDNLLNSIEIYFQQLNNYKIGDVIGVRACENSFELIKLAKPHKRVANLP